MYPVYWHAFVHFFNVAESRIPQLSQKNLKQFFYDALIRHAWQHIEMVLSNNFDLDLQYLDL